MSTLLHYLYQKYVVDGEKRAEENTIINPCWTWDEADIKRLFTHLSRHGDDCESYEKAVIARYQGVIDYCDDKGAIIEWLNDGCSWLDYWDLETGCRDAILEIAVDWMAEHKF